MTVILDRIQLLEVHSWAVTCHLSSPGTSTNIPFWTQKGRALELELLPETFWYCHTPTCSKPFLPIETSEEDASPCPMPLAPFHPHAPLLTMVSCTVKTPVSSRVMLIFLSHSWSKLGGRGLFSPKIAVGTNGSVIHRKQGNAEKVKRERTVNDWWTVPQFPQESHRKPWLYDIIEQKTSTSCQRWWGWETVGNLLPG